MLEREWDNIKLGSPVVVTAADYLYTGWLVSVFVKRSGAVRAVVEDVNGRLFVHNAKQLGIPEEFLSTLVPPARLH